MVTAAAELEKANGTAEELKPTEGTNEDAAIVGD